MYHSFDRFLQSGIKEYYERSARSNKTRFAALLILSGEAVPMAVDAMKGLLTPGRLAAGALGVMALRIGLRWVLGGPIGMVLTGLTAASMVAYYFNHELEIWDEVRRCRRVLEKTRQDYQSIQERFAAGRFSEDERDLMIDGLQQRFLRSIDMPQGSDRSDPSTEKEG